MKIEIERKMNEERDILKFRKNDRLIEMYIYNSNEDSLSYEYYIFSNMSNKIYIEKDSSRVMRLNMKLISKGYRLDLELDKIKV